MDEDIEPKEAISAFIASKPRLTTMADGRSRFYARIGIEHSQYLGNGQFERLEPTFHHLIAKERTAEIAHERLSKGDRIVAIGRVEARPDADDPSETIKEFVMTRFGHDAALSTYTVDRTARSGAAREAAGNDAVAQDGEPAARAEPSRGSAAGGRAKRTTASGRQLADIGAGAGSTAASTDDGIPF